jgi:hypothetical protein
MPPKMRVSTIEPQRATEAMPMDLLYLHFSPQKDSTLKQRESNSVCKILKVLMSMMEFNGLGGCRL